MLDGTFNALCRVFEHNSSWQSCLQILEEASLAGPGIFGVFSVNLFRSFPTVP